VKLVSGPQGYHSTAYFLLLHQFGVRAVIDYVLSKDRCSQDSVDFFCVDILQLAIENEVVAFSPQIYRSFLAQENERETIAILNPSQGV
jgi:hypothetical protein